MTARLGSSGCWSATPISASFRSTTVCELLIAEHESHLSNPRTSRLQATGAKATRGGLSHARDRLGNTPRHAVQRAHRGCADQHRWQVRVYEAVRCMTS